MRKFISVLAISAAMMFPSTIVHAADVPAVTVNLSAEGLTLARQFVTLLLPTTERDMVEQFETTSLAPLDAFEVVAVRTELKGKVDEAVKNATPVIRRHAPIIMEAYAQSYAREFSVAELSQLIAFASTPVGRHFLEDLQFAEFDPAVERAKMVMFEEVDAHFIEVRKAMCKRFTEVRIAEGQTDAKCGMA